MAEGAFPSRAEAVRMIEHDRARTIQLLERLTATALTATGIGGGEWSPKDLVGHLESWEELALDAIGAWERGGRSELEDLQATLDTDGINARNIERKTELSFEAVRRSSERTHAALVAAIEGLTDDRWAASATPGNERTVGEGVGGILGGPAGPFRHDEAHHADLEAFVQTHGGVAGSR
jgi:DinB superfamily